MLDRNDYTEPECVLCGEPAGRLSPVPMNRILEKLKQYEEQNDPEKMEKHLVYWLNEAEFSRDERGQLTLHNEMMGFYRMRGDAPKAVLHAEEALRLLEKLGMEKTITAGTVWINVGTVLEAFGREREALDYFGKARANYEQNLPPEDSRLGGLYNNMGLALAACGYGSEAEAMFRRALDVIRRQKGSEPEQAITWLNLADLLEAELPPEAAEKRIEACIRNAESLLMDEKLQHNAYYAFVCSKCAHVFGHHGYFLQEQEMLRRAEAVRNGREV